MADGVKVDGLRELNKALRSAAADSQDLSALMNKVGMLVVRAAKPPRRSGRLADSLRAGKGKTQAVVRAGNNARGATALPYARIQEYGWAARGQAPKMFLNKARDQKQSDIQRLIFEGIDNIIKKNKL